MDGVVILGGGLAGLGCARELPGSRIFESKPYSGGHAYSHELGGVHFDQGAHISHTKDEPFVKMICGAAGDVAETKASIVRNYWNRRWLTYPIQNNLHELPVDSRIRALTDFVQAQISRPESVPNYLEWCRAQYGEYLTNNFYRLYTDKYWRVAMEALATDWLRGRLLPSDLERIIAGSFEEPTARQEVFSSFRYPMRKGFFGFFERLYDDIEVHHNERAVEIDVESRTVRFASGRCEKYEHLASSIPLPVLVNIIKDSPTEVRDAAAKLRATELTCVNFIVNRPQVTDAHWFYIYDEDIDASRVSLPSNLATGSVPADRTAFQAEVFRLKGEPDAADGFVEKTLQQLGKVFDFHPQHDVIAADRVHVPLSYTISDHARGPAVELITSWLAMREIRTMGLFGRWKYVWSDEAYRQGREVGRAIIDSCESNLHAAK